MPLFEYDCRGCGQRFEYLVRADDPARCPACGGADLVKRPSVPSAHTNTPSASACPGCSARDSGECGGGPCFGGSCGL